ncbi:hypothetical protein [Geodermatophilus ruber]|uniref:Uncharacterized protein n=1 Tax=Geodermatophilus ruber TaxID=504800 RepID=A0A1I4DL28_9ACTN|nr:hypothetical protein [Geodermatophilus ruber]SFK92736.1 hypothetical protein SAMN04488085_104391 [Geodermatophilus ruber]
MSWALAVAIGWAVLVPPVGYLIGRALRRADARGTTTAPVDAAPAPPVSRPPAETPASSRASLG